MQISENKKNSLLAIWFSAKKLLILKFKNIPLLTKLHNNNIQNLNKVTKKEKVFFYWNFVIFKILNK